MENEKRVGGARPGAGRKPLVAGSPAVPVMIKMTEEQKAKLKRLGGPPWVRDKIDNAKEPKL